MEPFGSAPGPRSTPLSGPPSLAGPHPTGPQGNAPQPGVAPQGYQQPPFAQPQYGQPQYAQPQFAQPMFGTPMRRRRRKVTLTLGLLLVIGGIAAIVVGVVRVIDQVRIPEDDVVGRSTTGQEALSFERTALDPSRYTVYIVGGSASDSSNDAASVSCTIVSAGGSTTIFGSRQTTSVNINGEASVGSFTAAEGTVSVGCDAPQRFAFFVAEGGPRLSVGTFALPFIGAAMIIIGVILIIIGAVGKRVPAAT